MKKQFFLILVFLFLIPFIHAEGCIVYFYGNGCAHCARVEPVLSEAMIAHPGVEVRIYEVYSDRSNLALLTSYFDAQNVSQKERGVPALFIQGNRYVGDSPIIDNIDEIFANATKCPETSASENQESQISTLPMATVISAALVDSINPCAIAVLLILLGALIATGNKKRALIAGLLFTASIYIAYLLFGLGLFSALQVTGLSYWFGKVVGALAIIIGLFNIKDFFWYGGGGFVMEIPRGWRPTLKKMLSGVTSPLGAFVMGFAVCLFELPCTGGPYIFILGLLAERTTMISALPILLIYNVFFVLPLLLLTFGIYFGFANVEKATAWKDKNLRILHLIAGIVMLVLGILVVAGVI
ncbi:MAG: cytochrome c biogenesis protein CcdA [Nanoarchaeota archaeon]